jgi:hypothetical protein
MVRKLFASWLLTCTAMYAQSIEGRIVSTVNSTGIAGAVVDIFQDSIRLYQSTSESDGRFRIADVPPGSYTYCVQAHDYFPVQRACSVQTFQLMGESSRRDEDHDEPCPKLSGRVLDATGKPVPNAVVQVFSAKGRPGLVSLSRPMKKATITPPIYCDQVSGLSRHPPPILSSARI